MSFGLPSVSVPVLSNTTKFTLAACSSASALRMRIPYRAATPVPARIAAGVARPSAQGQAITITDTALMIAVAVLAPANSQPPRVISAITSTIGTNTAAIWSASRCTLGLEDCAASISLAIRSNRVSPGCEVTRIGSTASRFIAPASTVAPAAWTTGRLSPVIWLSSKLPMPSRIIPSTGTRSPGRNSRTSPRWTAASGTSALPRIWATLGRSLVKADTAFAASRLARPSRYLPSRMRVITTADDSKYNGPAPTIKS